jgi:uroporphyrinogen-III synthase
MRSWDLPPALCVGEKTANAWEEAGGTVAVVPEQYTAEALLEVLGEDLGGRSFLIMRPEVVKTELGKQMSGRGAEVDEIVIYRTVTPDEGKKELHDLLAAGRLDVVFFASPSAIEGIVKMAVPSTQYPVPSILDIPAICIGPTTAKAAEEAGFNEVYFPDKHTAEGMVNELIVISGALKKQNVERRM